MGCSYELNDILEISTAEGFPSSLLDRERHLQHPVTINNLKGKVFEFRNKPMARVFQLNPMRVFLAEHTEQGKWLFWGHIVINSLRIEMVKANSGPGASTDFVPQNWVTGGTFEFVEIYAPDYQKCFTEQEAPPGLNYFAATSQ